MDEYQDSPPPANQPPDRRRKSFEYGSLIAVTLALPRRLMLGGDVLAVLGSRPTVE